MNNNCRRYMQKMNTCGNEANCFHIKPKNVNEGTERK